ncbi:HDIG domain-containing protein [Treponema bryantii]|uniref:HDIG domain-containing protein n=1 Tax=Treponema bryantii TaxID=163 RepID=A0A1I3JND2_9SPIR|nr:HD domain-containing protein [Treponema bryantii]SFI61753.1 HDIG domain-containing protein [Treponema bryantii]
MKQLFTMDLKNYGADWKRSRRDSARAIIHVGVDKLALVYATKLGYYKFPGGGIHEGEDKIAALAREVQEEVGLVLVPESVREYGVASRYQKSGLAENTIFVQDNFYYECDVERDANGNLKIISQNLDAYEDEAGFELCIVSIKDAALANRQYHDTNDFNIAMIARDARVLEMMAGMKSEPSRCMAELLLEEGVKKNPGPWREHSYAVARAAEKMARAVNENCGEEKMNPDLAYIYGLLHDIGRQEGHTYIAHVYDGYHFLMSFGYEKAALICLTHSFNLKTTEDYIGKIDISDNQMEEVKQLLAAAEYDDYDRLIQLLDSTCGADGTLNLEQRMGDVKARYGYYPQGKWNKNFELKAYFEKLAGRDYYEIISPQ